MYYIHIYIYIYIRIYIYIYRERDRERVLAAPKFGLSLRILQAATISEDMLTSANLFRNYILLVTLFLALRLTLMQIGLVTLLRKSSCFTWNFW